jgi:CarD family transcriptional regulator
MKSPSRAKATGKKPAVGAARKPARPAAQAKKVATARRSSAAPGKKPASKSANAAVSRPPQPKAAPKLTPPKSERGTSTAVAGSKTGAKPAPKSAPATKAVPAAKPAPAPAKATPAAKAPAPSPKSGGTSKPVIEARPPTPSAPPTASAAMPKPEVAKPVTLKATATKPASIAKPPVSSPSASAPVAPAEAAVQEAAAPRPAPMPPRIGGPATTPRAPAKPTEFKAGDHVVYPTHGVGSVQGIETVQAAGYSLQVIVVTFEENRMTLRVPVNKAASSGLRKLASNEGMKQALDTLKGRARIKRTMWSRRAQEYEAKINSGDPVAIAEVVRDLHRNAGQPDQSFSERQIYEQALDRLATEVAAIDRTDKVAATEKLLQHLKGG